MTDTSLLAKTAIKLALTGQWQEAEKINKQILKVEPKNIFAYLRLAKVCTNLNRVAAAKKIYRKVLTLDRYNSIARRNIARFAKIKNVSFIREGRGTNPLFLEEPGKTKSVNLLRLTCEKNLAPLEIGEPVSLSTGSRSISVVSLSGRYLGRLPDDIAFRLIQLVKSGNHYQTFIRLVEKNRLQIFIREIKRSKRNLQVPSFPPKEKSEDYHTFLMPEIIDDRHAEEGLADEAEDF